MMENKLYCYVDETGQDTKGKFFLVVIVISNFANTDTIQGKLLEIELSSRKKTLKWKHTDKHIKRSYLEELLSVKEIQDAIYFRVYNDSKEYTTLTAFSIAAALKSRAKGSYMSIVIIDGLNEVEKEIVRRELKKLGVVYKKIKGLKDEQDTMLRLADAMAGFLRDAFIDKQPYASRLLQIFIEKKIIHEV